MASNYRNAAEGLVTVLQAGIPGLHGFAYPPLNIYDFPAAVVIPESYDPRLAFQGNSFLGTLRVVMLVTSGDSSEGWRMLYRHLDPTRTSHSVIKAVRADKTLDGKVDDSDVMRVENVGRRALWGGDYYGFDVVVSFIKTVN